MQDKKFNVPYLVQVGSWNRALNMARRTVGKKRISKDPSDQWKAKMLLSEHSPIRMVEYDVDWDNIKQRISVHFVRHHNGIEKFVNTQRDDISDKVVCSDDLPQGALNDMSVAVNAQAIINISRFRLCKAKPHSDTQMVWRTFLEELKQFDPVLVSKCVPNCIYRGRCPETTSGCGYDKTERFRSELEKYWSEYIND